jgi:tetratricopeptide (TPR) repeat protein
MDLAPVRELVLDPRRGGSAQLRTSWSDEVERRYREVEAAMAHLALPQTWDGRSLAWVDQHLELAAEVVLQIGELRGEYARTREWGDHLLEVVATGSAPRRAELMLRLSEVHRVSGNQERQAALVREAAELLHILDLSAQEVLELAPISCHALFCLGSLAFVEGRPDEARSLLGHAWSHGTDSDDHLWSLVNFALVEAGDERHDAALAFEEAAIAMAIRLEDLRALQATRNNRACTLRLLGRLDEAYVEFADLLPTILAEDIPDAVLTSAEDFACVLFDMGREKDGALLVGAAMAERDTAGVPRLDFQDASIEPSISAGRDRLGDAWDTLLVRGAELGVLAAVASALRPAQK